MPVSLLPSSGRSVPSNRQGECHARNCDRDGAAFLVTAFGAAACCCFFAGVDVAGDFLAALELAPPLAPFAAADTVFRPPAAVRGYPFRHRPWRLPLPRAPTCRDRSRRRRESGNSAGKDRSRSAPLQPRAIAADVTWRRSSHADVSRSVTRGRSPARALSSKARNLHGVDGDEYPRTQPRATRGRCKPGGVREVKITPEPPEEQRRETAPSRTGSRRRKRADGQQHVDRQGGWYRGTGSDEPASRPSIGQRWKVPTRERPPAARRGALPRRPSPGRPARDGARGPRLLA